ncbi:hypothetical protein SeMB42_g00679 [Synchytrium endobioticum]|uniref:Cytochrome c oxidase subunit IV n=1 Tax=Synchytrium endobioticum TaxID=286115 RepID=A0A507DPI3_9FUNG|nr:hypothetical protein SeLEV6574_g00835 [Synchytrium endobioticum]TPX53574.1 hypothetical protein SeMB42_g00679 [Synchytrium endobioticum]
MFRLSTRLSSALKPVQLLSRRNASASALAELETRWVKLPECEQGVIADTLAAVQRGDWKKMTLEEKRAAYFIAYGSYGARTPLDPTTNVRVWGTVAIFLALSYAAWSYSVKFRPALRTQTPEWEEATKQKAIEARQNPFSGTYAKYRKEQGDA